jgi:hypothetical protein
MYSKLDRCRHAWTTELGTWDNIAKYQHNSGEGYKNSPLFNFKKRSIYLIMVSKYTDFGQFSPFDAVSDKHDPLLGSEYIMAGGDKR